MLVIATGFLVLYFIHEIEVFLWIALIAGLTGSLFPGISQKLVLGWMWTGKKIGWLTSRIILSSVFFLILMPSAFLFGKRGKGYQTWIKAPINSNFNVRNRTFTQQDLKNPW